MSLTLKFYTQMQYDEKNMYESFQIFLQTLLIHQNLVKILKISSINWQDLDSKSKFGWIRILRLCRIFERVRTPQDVSLHVQRTSQSSCPFARHYLIIDQVSTSCQDKNIFLRFFSIYTAWILVFTLSAIRIGGYGQGALFFFTKININAGTRMTGYV
jgi:hypothetical protein